MREVSAAGDDDGIGEADGGLMPMVLRPAPGEGISARGADSRCVLPFVRGP